MVLSTSVPGAPAWHSAPLLSLTAKVTNPLGRPTRRGVGPGWGPGVQGRACPVPWPRARPAPMVVLQFCAGSSGSPWHSHHVPSPAQPEEGGHDSETCGSHFP